MGTEAHNIARTDRFLVQFGDPENGVLRASLRDYAGFHAGFARETLSKQFLAAVARCKATAARKHFRRQAFTQDGGENSFICSSRTVPLFVLVF